MLALSLSFFIYIKEKTPYILNVYRSGEIKPPAYKKLALNRLEKPRVYVRRVRDDGGGSANASARKLKSRTNIQAQIL